MLYEYGGKIYVRPFSSKLVEVNIDKKGNEYNVKATNRNVNLTDEIRKKMVEITLEEAYKKINKNGKSLDI
jgi:hypothetical protein